MRAESNRDRESEAPPSFTCDWLSAPSVPYLHVPLSLLTLYATLYPRSPAPVFTPDHASPERSQEAIDTKVQWVQPITKLFFFSFRHFALCVFYTGSFENTCMGSMSTLARRIRKVNICFCSVLNWHSSTFLAVKDAVVYLDKSFL